MINTDETDCVFVKQSVVTNHRYPDRSRVIVRHLSLMRYGSIAIANFSDDARPISLINLISRENARTRRASRVKPVRISDQRSRVIMRSYVEIKDRPGDRRHVSFTFAMPSKRHGY